MIPRTIETESISSSYAKSETNSIAETESSVSSSVSSNPQDGAGLESKRKLKGLRSIRLLRFSSMRSSMKGPKSRYENIDAQSPGRHSSVDMSDASHNYMKATSSSHAKESFQSSERMFTRKNLTRIPTLKLRRSLTRKLSGGTDLRRKLKSSRSIKLTSVKGLRSSGQGKNKGKAITFNYSQNSKHPSENSQRIMARRLSFKLSSPYMIRSRKVFTEESSQISQSSDSSLHKATCSSTLKNSHFPNQLEQALEGNGPQEVSLTRKICRYTYCSLHGGHRDNVPPLKRFVSMRRRQLKTHKNTKLECQPVTGSKHSGTRKKGNQTSQRICSENPANIISHSSRSHRQNDKKPARDLPVKTCDAVASTFNEGGSSGGDNKENISFRCNAEVLLGETSFSRITFDQYVNDSLVENGYSLSSFLAIKETDMECCSTVTCMDKPGSELTETVRNNNIVVARNPGDEITQSVLMDDRSDILHSELLEDPDLCDKHSSLIDDSVVAGHEVLGVEASRDKQEERNSILELIDPESSAESLNANEFRSARDQSLDKLKASHQNVDVELTSTPGAMCSASKFHTSEEEITAKDKNVDSRYGILQETSTLRESRPASTTDATYKIPEVDKKYVKMWHLMYKHAVLSNAEKVEGKLQSDQEDKEAQEKEGLSSNGVNNSPFQDTDDENENVVKLVQKAFDEILLPEMDDASFDDDLKSQYVASEDDLLEKNQRKDRRDGSTSTSRDFPQEEAKLKPDDEEEKASQKMGNKPEPKTPKSWSRLKKILLLKRFVKAIDKVRKINPGKPRNWPSDANLEVEKVLLRRLKPGEEKNVEEWMLDYALQKVISRLAPAQKQRVALLVEAFETVLPFHDLENGPQSSAPIETQAPAVQGKETAGRERDYDFSAKLLLGNAFHSHQTFEEHADDAHDNPMAEQQGSNMVEEVKSNPTSRATDGDLIRIQSLAGNHEEEENTAVNDNVYVAETKDSASLSSGVLVNSISTSLEEDLANEMVNGVSQDMISGSITEIPSGKSESHGRDFENENLIHASEEPLSRSNSLILKSFARALGSSLAPSAAPSEQLDESLVGSKDSLVKAKPEIEKLEQFPPVEGTVNWQEKQNHTGLWYLVYRRMASGIAANDFKPLVYGDSEKGQGYDNSRITGTDTSISHGSIPVGNQYIPLNDHPVTGSEAEFRQLEAIKIVEEAIDAILVDAQEHSLDGQSVTSRNISDDSEQSYGVEVVNSEGLYQKEERVTSDSGVTQEQDEEPALKDKKPLSRNWSNLKKAIMLRRFIKALEKVRKFNPQGPQHLLVDPDPEAEKVNLRHQDLGERRGSEEWMLDHALRQAVAQLTPARKRKVELLVEAFEAVMPTIKN